MSLIKRKCIRVKQKHCTMVGNATVPLCKKRKVPIASDTIRQIAVTKCRDLLRW